MASIDRQTLSPIRTSDLSALNSPSPPNSAGSSPSLSQKRSRFPLSLDLSSLPPLSSPAPPSNTLLITRLDDPKIFHAASLATIREHLNSIAHLNSFSPLKSMHRIIVSFLTVEDAIKCRQQIDGTAFLANSVAKCYFGEPTPIDQNTKYLERPDAGRLFFISPPPSPPVGWEMRTEDPPNRDVHAEDLASKLQKLTNKMETPESSPVSEKIQYTSDELAKLKSARSRAFSGMNEDSASPSSASPKKMRSRSSTLIYDPKAHGDSPGLPAVMVEAEDSDDEIEAEPRIDSKLVATARPPIELMEQ